MAQSRMDLQTLLKTLTSNVYFQPPPGHQMQYPCIVYSRDGDDTSYADNLKYLRKKRYQVTVIDRDPDSDIPDKVAALPLSTFDRFFTADQLNHDVFNVFF